MENQKILFDNPVFAQVISQMGKVKFNNPAFAIAIAERAKKCQSKT